MIEGELSPKDSLLGEQLYLYPASRKLSRQTCTFRSELAIPLLLDERSLDHLDIIPSGVKRSRSSVVQLSFRDLILVGRLEALQLSLLAKAVPPDLT